MSFVTDGQSSDLMQLISIRNYVKSYNTISTIDSLDYYAVLTASKLVQLITGSDNQSHRSLLSVFEEYIDLIVQTDGSKVAYRRRFERIAAKIPSKTIMNSMTRPTILGFALWLREKNYENATEGFCIFAKFVLSLQC